MNRIMRIWNRNRRKILIIIMVMVFLFGFLQLLNFLEKNKKEKTEENHIEIENIEQIVTNSLITEQSTITGEILDSNKLKKDRQIIETFFDYCNNGDVGKAYNLLSEDCKKEMYTDEESFKNAYYLKAFSDGKKIYTMENWIGNTYKVNLKENILETGNSTDYARQDLITIIKQGNEEKLNINNYIGKKKINKIKEVKDINIEVIEEQKYKDYTVYAIEVDNKSDERIALDDLVNIESIYVQDKNDIQYPAFTNEISQAQLVVGPKVKKGIKIKFYNSYSSTKKINKLVFSRVNFDYNDETNQNNNFLKIEIDI